MLIAMKKASLYALKEDRAAILLALQKSGQFMVVADGDNKIALPGAEKATVEIQKTRDALKFMEIHGAKDSFLAPKNSISFDSFMSQQEEGEALAEQIGTLSEKINSLRNEADTMLAQVEQLQPWMQLDIPLEKLVPTESAVFFSGYLDEDNETALMEDLQDLPVEIMKLGLSLEGRAMVVFAHKSKQYEVKHALKRHEFADMVFPKRNGLAEQIAKDLNQAAMQKDALADELDGEAKKLMHRKNDLKLYYDQEAAKQERLAHGGVETEKTFFLQGWVRADAVHEVEKALVTVTEAYDLSFSDPAEGEIPPTVMENSTLVTPYEAITEMYSRPRIGSIDPNSAMAPFYFIFFGMMLSDAGYGLVLTILLFAAYKILKPSGMTGKMLLVILMGSVSTFIWGACFGGWFGLEWKPLMFVPMKEPLKMLTLCFGLGGIHLVTGMFYKIRLEMQRGHGMDAFYDQVSWLILFAGLLLMGLMDDGTVGKYMALTGVGIIVLFGGREKKNPIKRLLSGLLALYNISAYVSDLLSYSRLFALGLATGVIAMVINTIAGMLWGAGPLGMVAAIVILVGGHIFNIMINVLGSFVHTSRLQYIEFFGKFFEAGGRAFVPMALRTKYYDITK